MTQSDHGVVDLGGPVLVIGTGLIGTSAALALRRRGVPVLLEDVDPIQLWTAEQLGAGHRWSPDADGPEPALVVVAVPPRHAAEIIASACERFPRATITDVTSVKERVLHDAAELGADIRRVVGGHPMAGREVSGAVGARADLMDGRWWILTPGPATEAARLDQVRQMVRACGALVVDMTAAEHDRAVALVSHAPQVMSSVLAEQLVGARAEYVQIAGQGLRDMTRIAGSDSALWTDILSANAGPVAEVVAAVMDGLGSALTDLRQVAEGDTEGKAGLTRVLTRGASGRKRIPGKHGAAALAYAEVAVLIADRPGELARLFVAAGEAGINLEDVRIEHVLGRPSGLVELSVQPEAAEGLAAALLDRGFDVRV